MVIIKIGKKVIIMADKTNINRLITINLRTSTNPYFIRNYKNFDNAYFI